MGSADAAFDDRLTEIWTIRDTAAVDEVYAPDVVFLASHMPGQMDIEDIREFPHVKYPWY